MKDFYKRYLFEKNYFVSEMAESETTSFEALFALANKFNIKIVVGAEFAALEHVKITAECIGEYVPEAFYTRFPQSVWDLIEKSKKTGVNLLLFDQIFHYINTYGFNDFSNPGHSVFEENFKKVAFKEETPVKEFSIIPELDAIKLLGEYVEDLLKSTRPLSQTQYEFVLNYVTDYYYTSNNCASKNTAIKLLIDTRDVYYAKFLSLADVVSLLDELNFKIYNNKNIKKLNLKNKDRKFITKILHLKLNNVKANVAECFEKQNIWRGLLHHLHFKPQNKFAQDFVKQIREGKNISAYSSFEKALQSGDVKSAAQTLINKKGTAAYIRNLNYVLSRCKSDEDFDCAIQSINTQNPIVLIQLLLQYRNYDARKLRSFKFVKFNLLRIHNETSEEKRRRKSVILKKTRTIVAKKLMACLKSIYKNRLGKVYIDHGMELVALPLQEAASSGGFGTLAKGTKIPLKDGKKIRAFTYWEKVNDIDLSVFGLDKKCNQTEFSWRTMSLMALNQQTNAITYSGDQTSGFNGGSEYFDIEVQKFMQEYPDICYLVFCNNVYSAIPFSNCVCKAGYMLRDINETGEVFEPKTVKTSFTINCESTYAYLFALDLKKREIIWLNVNKDSASIVAGDSQMKFLTQYFNITEVINVSSLFKMLATEVVNSPEEADIIVSDKNIEVANNQKLIRSYDFEKLLAYINNNF